MEAASGKVGEGVENAGLYSIGWNERHAEAWDDKDQALRCTRASRAVHAALDAAIAEARALLPAATEEQP